MLEESLFHHYLAYVVSDMFYPGTTKTPDSESDTELESPNAKDESSIGPERAVLEGGKVKPPPPHRNGRLSTTTFAYKEE